MTRLVGCLAVLAAAAACNRDPDASQTTKTLAPITTTTKTVSDEPARAPAAAPASASAERNTSPAILLVQPAAAQREVVSPADVSSAGTAASSAAPTAKGTSATVGKAKLALHGCRLEVAWVGGAKTTKDIELPEPCLFVTTRAGAQVVKTDRGQTLLVVSSRRDEATEKDCDTKVRAVVVNADRVAVSKEKQEIAMCGADGPFDTILFHTLAQSAS
jgi:hypothetical protein